ncbi:MAG: Flp family type IVb pilin [Pseudomonadota bacterium]
MKKFFRDESGATAIEYAMILGLVSMAIVGSFYTLGNSIENMYGFISNEVIDSMPP